MSETVSSLEISEQTKELCELAVVDGMSRQSVFLNFAPLHQEITFNFLYFVASEMYICMSPNMRLKTYQDVQDKIWLEEIYKEAFRDLLKDWGFSGRAITNPLTAFNRACRVIFNILQEGREQDTISILHTLAQRQTPILRFTHSSINPERRSTLSRQVQE